MVRIEWLSDPVVMTILFIAQITKPDISLNKSVDQVRLINLNMSFGDIPFVCLVDCVGP